MAKFLAGNELNAEIERLFENADKQLILISPYIKLHERYISVLKDKIESHKLQLIIVFGKNEDDKSKSMSEEDFNFFKEFPNIEIRYEKNLHAKYYANEEVSILTSMNLHKYSNDNNIEAGTLTKATLLGNLAYKFWEGDDTFDSQAWKYFTRVIDQGELLFQKIPEYEKGLLGITKNYTSSKVTVDKLSDFFQALHSRKATPEPTQYGYCIRTGEKIPFNLQLPLSKAAFQSWSKFNNKNFKEKFCHFSGEQSNGETSFSKPVLRKYWEDAKKILDHSKSS